MDTTEILRGIDEEIARLRQVRNLLSGRDGHSPAMSFSFGNRPRKKRVLSAEARAKIAAAQKRRWARQKSLAKK